MKKVKKQEQPNFRPAAPAIKGRIESRKQEHVGGSYAFHIFYDTEQLCTFCEHFAEIYIWDIGAAAAVDDSADRFINGDGMNQLVPVGVIDVVQLFRADFGCRPAAPIALKV